MQSVSQKFLWGYRKTVYERMEQSQMHKGCYFTSNKKNFSCHYFSLRSKKYFLFEIQIDSLYTQQRSFLYGF